MKEKINYLHIYFIFRKRIGNILVEKRESKLNKFLK